ncbi:MAG: class F sortase [Jatrophihabitantaceae bacterium]
MPARALRRVTVALTVLALGAGLALVIGAAIGLRQDRSLPPDVGTVAGAAPSRPPAPAPSVSVPSVSVPSVSVPRPARSVPATVSIPSLNVTAQVLPVVNTGGVLGVPDDPAQLGWWTGGAQPGAARGSVIIDGHVDSASTGPGALFRLGRLNPGDRIAVTSRTGASHSYTVTGRRSYPKAAGLPAELFDRAGPSRLVLISCGGAFDRSAGSYLDNIVVFAAPS